MASSAIAATAADPEPAVLARGRASMLVRVERPSGFAVPRADPFVPADGGARARHSVGAEAVVLVAGDNTNPRAGGHRGSPTERPGTLM